ncbi:RDD family protein [Oscillochloris sp. ZM17-4]|uniref:RDD family protein n=1 Tax=Oscillochloris sp. ZM17-4 TaxID=2866714 RepID=UPI001C73D70F|nr:RDD family protein [Oscillochloris sp. ZM17-4]MBX0327104.1 RDD family protein [Oscillochloris sp. ZM17-4]
MDDRYLVETPEIIDLAYDVAGLGSRCLAAAIDTLLILLVLGGLGAALFFAVGQLVDEAAGSLVLAAWSLLSFAALWGYYLAFELVWAGQTPGKRALGLRAVREGGRPLTASASAVRNLVRIVDFLPFGYGLGTLVMFADRRSRRLGDLAAGTLVVREGAAISLDRLTAQSAPVLIPPRAPDAPPTPLLPDLQRIAADDYELAQDFLRRRDRLAPEPRARMAAQLAAALRARLGLPDGGEPELFIEHLVREYRVYRDT